MTLPMQKPDKGKQHKALKSLEMSPNIDEMICLASRKLHPIIELLVDNSSKSEHFLTRNEFNDVILASRLVKEIKKALDYADIETNIRNLDFTLESYEASINDEGKIYVETILLLQLIDLYNTLEDIKETMTEFYRSIGIHSFVQTESGCSISSQESSNPNKIVFRITRPLTKSSTSFGLLQNFIVMPSVTDIDNEDNIESSPLPLRQSKSQILSGLDKDNNNFPTKRVKSTGSFVNEKMSEVTDVYGAKRVVVKCICDLQEVSKYLGIPRKDVATICSRVDVDNLPSSSRRKSSAAAKSLQGEGVTSQHKTDGDHMCCCPDCFAELGTGADIQECDDDKVIICIKSCNEDEGDVQIVIRQCPDCRKSAEPSHLHSDKDVSSVSSEKLKKSAESEKPQPQTSVPEKNIETASEQSERRSGTKRDSDVKSTQERRSTVAESGIIEMPPDKVESTALHNKDSQGSYVCSEESGEGLLENHIESLPKSPRQSVEKPDSIDFKQEEPIFEPSIPARSSAEAEATGLEKTNLQQQLRVSCSKIRLFQTTNLCLETDTGQELVISLTVTPRNFDNKKLSLRDIFSEDDYANQGRLSYKEEFIKSEAQATYKERSSLKSDSVSHKSDKSAKLEPSTNMPSSYYVEDRVIPLERTKVCSSVDFDVTTLESKIREKGIQHKNAKIVVQLRELGIDNLLRACRPAKCCRKAVLNEKMKKCLPYPPSLRSLPLDDEDMNVINQSLQMSLQKVKNSTNLKKDFYTNDTYYANPIQTIMYFFVEEPKNTVKSLHNNDYIRKKLSYYINLVNDLEFKPISNYDILYFGIETDSNNSTKGNERDVIKDFEDSSRRSVDVQMIQVITKPHKYTKSNFKNREERPMLTGFAVDKSNSLLIKNVEKNMYQDTAESPLIVTYSEEMEKLSRIKNKIKKVSRIPVYRGLKSKHTVTKKKYIRNEEDEQQMHEISLDLLPEEYCSLRDINLSNDMESKISLPSASNSSEQEKLPNNSVNQQTDSKSYPFKTKETSGYSIISNCTPKKARRKKKIFYLSRSKSDISLKTLQSIYKNKKDSGQHRYTSEELKNDLCFIPDTKKEITSRTKNTLLEESSEIILDYFSKMLYKMIARKICKEKIMKNIALHKVNQETSTENQSKKVLPGLFELYKRLSNKYDMQESKFEIKKFERFSHHELKAKQSQSCILSISKRSEQHIAHIMNNTAQQTSLICGHTKQCQTSSSHLAYFSRTSLKLNDAANHNKIILKKIYNPKLNTAIPQDCEEFKKIIVMCVSSEQSLKSNFSDKDFLTSASERSSEYWEYSDEQTLSNSLLKLKETLEKYESVKNEITQGPRQEADINPIEYFVYQMCVCNKFNKKPSVLQKVLSKTKGLFSSVEHDICSKYKNQRDFLNMSAADKMLCYRCGCLISKCNGPTNKKSTQIPSTCQCTPENKPTRLSSQSGYKRHKDSNEKATRKSKITSASISSLKSMKTCFKQSLSNALNRRKEKGSVLCTCDKETTTIQKNGTICVPEGVTAISCKKKDISTETTKDSTTQKCQCEKCENFADDGTCCCSHCLGCLDKTFDAKPENNNIGTLCKCIEEPEEDIKSEPSIPANNVKTVNDNDGNLDNIENSVQKAGLVDSDEPKKESSMANKSSLTNDSNSVNKNSNPTVMRILSDNQNIGESENIDMNNDGDMSTNNDTTSYYFLTSPASMFSQFRFVNRNPFEQYLLNFPDVNMFRLNES